MLWLLQETDIDSYSHVPGHTIKMIERRLYSFILRCTFYISEKGVDSTIVVYIFNVIGAGIIFPQTRYDLIFPPYFN